MKYHLAAHLGYRSVAALNRSITVAELDHWEALKDIEPWGPYRLDMLFALLRVQIKLTWHSDKNPAIKLKDFLPQWGIHKPKTREEQIAEADAEWERSSGVFFDAME